MNLRYFLATRQKVLTGENRLVYSGVMCKEVVFKNRLTPYTDRISVVVVCGSGLLSTRRSSYKDYYKLII